ncbi:unnamed protein product [Didymodactylos carnosus]|uniref:Uncharacterized protein n=1 Tax=Didymodactylos carnosus TaxID=1234261 RepID=A0A814CCN0_9BILA|nr:unnamed protein product [Didymodactylos carnosus]CAF3715275.1 unnamed protein product [Didymodactylos carnosus]
MLQDGSTDKDGCRAQKLSILNKIKCLETANNNANRLLFPIHHKYLKDNRNLNNSNYNNIDNVTTDDVEKIILSAYETAKVLIDNLKMCKLLKQNKIYTLKRLSTYISNSVRSSSNVTDNTMIDDDVDNELDTSSSSGNEDNDYYGEDNESENISEGEDDDKIPLDHFAQVRNTTFSGTQSDVEKTALIINKAQNTDVESDLDIALSQQSRETATVKKQNQVASIPLKQQSGQCAPEG